MAGKWLLQWTLLKSKSMICERMKRGQRQAMEDTLISLVRIGCMA